MTKRTSSTGIYMPANEFYSSNFSNIDDLWIYAICKNNNTVWIKTRQLI